MVPFMKNSSRRNIEVDSRHALLLQLLVTEHTNTARRIFTQAWHVAMWEADSLLFAPGTAG